MKKVTIIGDIMVEPPFLKQAENDGKYDFYTPMKALGHIFDESDYVIGNLETPLAGEDAVYTNRIVSFNAPDEVADAIKMLGIDVVSTANNHCLDRGFEGLERTLKVLDERGIAHTGTYPKGFSGDRNHYFEIGDTKFALIAYAHSTNYGISDALPQGETAVCVNNSRPLSGGAPTYLRRPESYYKTAEYFQQLLGRPLLWEETVSLRAAMGISFVETDGNIPFAEVDEYVKKIGEDLKVAREKADIVFYYPHMGGQFNVEPGNYSKYFLYRCSQLGFDGIFAAHSHTTQKAEYLNGTPCFYSVGNVTMSPCTLYQVPESLPEYGLAIHLYVDEKKIQKITLSIIKMVEDSNTPLKVVPVDLLYAELCGESREKLVEDVKAVYKRVTGKVLPDGELKKEYDF